jgi:hypothetical protein
MYAMGGNEIARGVRDGIADEFAEGYKNGTAWLLTMWHAADHHICS